MATWRIYANRPLAELGLPMMVLNALQRGGKNTVGQVADMTVGELLDLRRIGMASAGDLIARMSAPGGPLDELVAALEADIAALREAVGKYREAQE